MTNEEKAAHIRTCNAVITGSMYLEPLKDVARIALAALEAPQPEPVAYRWQETTGWRYAAYKLSGEDVEPLFTASPAVNLAELVPDEKHVNMPDENMDDVSLAEYIGWNACRAEMLRRVEQKTK